MNFNLVATDVVTSARSAEISTHHSTFKTPVFMPIGTAGAVKTIDPKFLIARYKAFKSILLISLNFGNKIIRN